MADDLITGATSHVGFAVLVATLKAGHRVRASVRHSSVIKSFFANLDFVVVPDITAFGAFDACLHRVTYIEHVASPLPRPTEDPENDIIIPAVRGTISILNSALKVESIRRVVITSSAVAVIPRSALSKGDSENVYTANSRVRPLPSAPWDDHSSAYRASKVLALDATDRFLAERRPHFSILNVMPGYVIGANELVNDPSKVGSGSNGVVMGVVMGPKTSVARPCVVVDVQDVAQIQVAALDERRVEGSKSFLLDTDSVHLTMRSTLSKNISLRRLSIPAVHLRLDVSDSIRTFGPLKNYETQVRSVVAHYLALQRKSPGKTK
ncbi:hypothetical protein V1508DRAFT_447108 [Lipomyces doorenjongii]|uniref:uncharacterized protein n=1 Tax=Lipomyces doorenjongii TaxID=383834 RepID=UPI0034CDF062